MPHLYTAAIAATQGARSYQEDAAALWPGPAAAVPPFNEPPEDGLLIAVLADGMGGHAGGALASRTVCRQFLQTFARERAGMRDRLRLSLTAANRAIALEVESKRALRGMGSTLVGTVFTSEGLEWVSVGDSPLFLLRSGHIELVNEDHSLAPLLDELARAGRISAEQARTDSRRHMLRSAVTGEDLDLIDLSLRPLTLQPGDHVVLASDGIHTIETAEIARVVKGYEQLGPQAIADALVREVEAMRDPHQDNFTVVVVRIDEGPVADAPTGDADAAPSSDGPNEPDAT